MPGQLTFQGGKMTIDKHKLRGFIQLQNSKKTPANTLVELLRELQMFFLELYSELKNISIYHLSQWILGSYYWIKNRNKKVKKSFNRGDIIYADLGHSNYGYEASYEHPCVVIYNGYDFLLVIPGSTGRHGVRSDFILSCDNGFQHPTGLQLDQVRYISKARVKSDVVGRVDTTILDYINDFILFNYCGDKKVKLEKAMDAWENIVNNLNKTIDEKTKEIDIKDKRIKNLEDRLDETETKLTNAMNDIYQLKRELGIK